MAGHSGARPRLSDQDLRLAGYASLFLRVRGERSHALATRHRSMPPWGICQLSLGVSDPATHPHQALGDWRAAIAQRRGGRGGGICWTLEPLAVIDCLQAKEGEAAQQVQCTRLAGSPPTAPVCPRLWHAAESSGLASSAEVSASGSALSTSCSRRLAVRVGKGAAQVGLPAAAWKRRFTSILAGLTSMSGETPSGLDRACRTACSSARWSGGSRHGRASAWIVCTEPLPKERRAQH